MRRGLRPRQGLQRFSLTKAAVAVLRNGVVQEMGPRDQILRNPQTEYTQRLVAAVPVPDAGEQRRRREASAGLFD